MKLNHLNLTVTDVAETSRFLQTYFGLRKMGGNNAMVFLRDENGMVLALMKARSGEEVVYPRSFHIGFIQPSEEEVNRINRQLRADGFDVAEPRHFHGSWTFYMQAPGGFVVEVLH